MLVDGAVYAACRRSGSKMLIHDSFVDIQVNGFGYFIKLGMHFFFNICSLIFLV